MAPELLQKGKMTRAADVYSFAMIMVELFTCKRLFEGLAQQQVLPLPSLSSPASSVPCVSVALLLIALSWALPRQPCCGERWPAPKSTCC